MKAYIWKLLLIILIFILILTFILKLNIVKAKENSQIKLPIIMYHSFLKDTARSGEYVITPDTFEKDLIYLKQNNYHTITMTDLINYVYNDIKLPPNPIILTFDDGCYNNLGYAVPLLKKYHMKAVISIVGSYTDNYSKTNEVNLNYSYLRWSDIKVMLQDGTIEFQNHTYSLHSNNSKRSGSMKRKNESIESYRKVLEEDIMKLQEEFKTFTGYLPNTFTYPYGEISKESIPIIKEMGFKASLSCNSGINKITKDPECLYCLKRYNRPSNITTNDFFTKIEKALL